MNTDVDNTKRLKRINPNDLFSIRISALKKKFDYQVRASKPIVLKSKKIDYHENDILIDKLKASVSIAERNEYIVALLNNFKSYFDKYICLLKHDYRAVLSKDTLQFISLFSTNRTKDLGMSEVGKTCAMFKGVLRNYSDEDLRSEFTIIAIQLMERYRRRAMVSFTQYFIKLFRFRLANLIRSISPDLGNSLAFNDNILSPSHLDKRLQAYHELYQSDLLHPNEEYDCEALMNSEDIDAMWVLRGKGIARNLKPHERFMLFRRYVQDVSVVDIAKEQHTSSVRLNRLYTSVTKKLNIE